MNYELRSINQSLKIDVFVFKIRLDIQQYIEASISWKYVYQAVDIFNN